MGPSRVFLDRRAAGNSARCLDHSRETREALFHAGLRLVDRLNRNAVSASPSEGLGACPYASVNTALGRCNMHAVDRCVLRDIPLAAAVQFVVPITPPPSSATASIRDTAAPTARVSAAC